MKSCKHCGTIVDLFKRNRLNKIQTFSICKTCYQNKRSVSLKGRIPWNKDKKDIYSKETLDKMSNSKKGSVSPRKGITLSDETISKISISKKGTSPWNKGFIGYRQGIKTPEHVKLKISLSNRINRIIRLEENLGYMPKNIGKNEKKSLDMIERKLNITLERQYPVLGYFLDGYDKENNVVYEVYEKYHYSPKQLEKDIIRENNIIKVLKCAFVKIIDI